MVLFAALVLAIALATGCGSASLHLPRVSVSSFGGPKAYEWNIKTASHGSGFGFSVLVIQYPDGHRGVWGGTLLQDGVSGTATFNYYKDMAPAHYEYFIYGVPTNSKLSWYFVPKRAQA